MKAKILYFPEWMMEKFYARQPHEALKRADHLISVGRICLGEPDYGDEQPEPSLYLHGQSE